MTKEKDKKNFITQIKSEKYHGIPSTQDWLRRIILYQNYGYFKQMLK